MSQPSPPPSPVPSPQPPSPPTPQHQIIGPQIYMALNELYNVETDVPVNDGDVLTYLADTQKWTNQPAPSGGGSVPQPQLEFLTSSTSGTMDNSVYQGWQPFTTNAFPEGYSNSAYVQLDSYGNTIQFLEAGVYSVKYITTLTIDQYSNIPTHAFQYGTVAAYNVNIYGNINGRCFHFRPAGGSGSTNSFNNAKAIDWTDEYIVAANLNDAMTVGVFAYADTTEASTVYQAQIVMVVTRLGDFNPV